MIDSDRLRDGDYIMRLGVDWLIEGLGYEEYDRTAEDGFIPLGWLEHTQILNKVPQELCRDVRRSRRT
jgi:hypothetical protein